MKILITGTPGTGKTTLSNEIEHKYGIKHIDVSAMIKKHKLYEQYDDKLDTCVFYEDVVGDWLDKEVLNYASFVIDTHTPCVATNIKFDYIFHLRADFQTLRERFALRKYSDAKIEENVDAEAFNVVGEELEEYFSTPAVTLVNGCDFDLPGVNLKPKDVLSLLNTIN